MDGARTRGIGLERDARTRNMDGARTRGMTGEGC